MWGISYWVFPVISALCWLGMLLGLLISWLVEGRPHYESMDPTQDIAYISDIGAQWLKPLFIAGSCVTTIFLDLAFFSERWLRHNGRLVPNTSIFQKVLSGLGMVFAVVGTVGLICLSIFDTLRHPTLHDLFLLLFIGGYVISAIFTCWEYQRLGIHLRQHRILRISFWIKLTFIVIEVCLAIGFGVCNFRDKWNQAAVLEWVIALIFTLWVFSFLVDLIPAIKTKGAPLNRATQMEVEENGMGRGVGYDGAAAAVPYQGHVGSFPGRNTAESDRTLGANDVRYVNGKPAAPEMGTNF